MILRAWHNRILRLLLHLIDYQIVKIILALVVWQNHWSRLKLLLNLYYQAETFYLLYQLNRSLYRLNQGSLISWCLADLKRRTQVFSLIYFVTLLLSYWWPLFNLVLICWLICWLRIYWSELLLLRALTNKFELLLAATIYLLLLLIDFFINQIEM